MKWRRGAITQHRRAEKTLALSQEPARARPTRRCPPAPTRC